MYCISAFLLINISNLSITKQISNCIAILTYFRYFMGCLWLCLTGAKDAKGVDVMGAYIGSFSFGETFARVFSIAGISIVGTCIGVAIKPFGTNSLSLINALSMKEGFIDILLNLVRLCGSSLITNLF